MTHLHPTRVQVDLQAIRHNYRQVREKVPSTQKVCCVVKSNAYGHGLEKVSEALAAEGADGFAVRDIAEGIQLRKHGITQPILFLLGIVDDAISDIVAQQLTPVLFDLDVARRFNEFLSQAGKRHAVHIKIDSGMTRLGVPAATARSFFKELRTLDHLVIEGVLTHLADATDRDYTRRQAQAITTVRRELSADGWEIPVWHFANSIGAVENLFPESNMVRAGLVLYGSYPASDIKDVVTLKPALSWQTEILDLKDVPAGTPISYECTYVTRRPSRIAALPIGYADGYPRKLSNCGQVLVRGQRAPVVGRVCMDLTMIDVTEVSGVALGDQVTVLGTDASQTITAEEMAQWADTISYEILARIAARVPRLYQD